MIAKTSSDIDNDYDVNNEYDKVQKFDWVHNGNDVNDDYDDDVNNDGNNDDNNDGNNGGNNGGNNLSLVGFGFGIYREKLDVRVELKKQRGGWRSTTNAIAANRIVHRQSL